MKSQSTLLLGKRLFLEWRRCFSSSMYLEGSRRHSIRFTDGRIASLVAKGQGQSAQPRAMSAYYVCRKLTKS